MTWLGRVVVGWMAGGLLAVMLAVGLPAFALYGAAAWWAGPEARLAWLDVGLPWVLRVIVCGAVWLIAKRAARTAGHRGPSGPMLAVSAWAGLACGLVAGFAVRDAWGLSIVVALGLPPESFVDDIVGVFALGGYAFGALLATQLPKGRIVTGLTQPAVEQGAEPAERHVARWSGARR